MEENRKYFFLPYVLDLIHHLEQNFCPDSNFRVKTMYESVKWDVLMIFEKLTTSQVYLSISTKGLFSFVRARLKGIHPRELSR